MPWLLWDVLLAADSLTGWSLHFAEGAACVNLVPVQSTQPSRPPLEPAELVLRLGPGSRWDTHVLDETPSTNLVLADYAREGRDEGFVVVADHQTAGRGRLDRSWVTPPRAALTLSALLVPVEVPLARWPWLPLLAGVAVAEAVRRVARLEAVLKWPNDVLVGTRKVAGILVEQVDRPRGPAAVIGVGINVSSRAHELPVQHATSLELAGAGEVNRAELLAEVLDALGEHYDAWRRAGGDAQQGLRGAYQEICATLGQQVRVALPADGTVVGEAIGIDPEGRLLVRSHDGVVTLGAGDVVHVRAS